MALMPPHIIFCVSIVVQKYYSCVPAPRCKEHEMKHICKYHGRQAGERGLESMEEEVSSFFFFSLSKIRQASKDFYIEVSPGIYSVTAVSEDMVQQTHVVDVNAGQSVDLTFVL
ncbi:AKIP1 protein, partial [Campylorhamphus procurvoides]|nr:AKIP1 protein [Campylorhamphus procurvoides]